MFSLFQQEMFSLRYHNIYIMVIDQGIWKCLDCIYMFFSRKKATWRKNIVFIDKSHPLYMISLFLKIIII